MGSHQEGREALPQSLMPIPPHLRNTESSWNTATMCRDFIPLPLPSAAPGSSIFEKKYFMWAPEPDSHFMQFPYHHPTQSGQEQLHLHASQLLLQGPGRES